MATTDAISVACKQLGIGADVYWDKDGESKYSMVEPKAEPKKKTNLDRVAPVLEELKRTGYSTKAVCKNYNITDIAEMNNDQIKDFLEKMSKVPSKEQQ
jgi:hypothetical protein